jgi:hypothetical protein
MLEFQTACADVEVTPESNEETMFTVIESGLGLGSVFVTASFTLNRHQMEALVAWWAARKAEIAAGAYQGA